MQQLRGVPMRDLILLMLALGVLVTFNVLRTEEQPEPSSLLDSYSTFDAGSGGYRAWYELLQREHVAVDQFQQRPAFLDHSASTLVWAEPIAFDPRQTQNTKDDITALERWVKAGGRFIYLGHDETAAKAGVLKLPATSSAGSPRALSIASALRATGIRRVALTTHLRWKLPTKLAATALIADASGPLAVTYRYGAGTIVALVDEAAFDNAHIAQTDNARLALALTGASVGAGTVAFDETAHGYLIPEHWWQIVPRRLLVGVLLALGAFGIALFGSAIRLGPPIVPPRRDDASSAEFVDSLAALFERGHAIQKSLDDIVRSTLRVVAGAFGLPAEAQPQEIEARIERPDLRSDFQTVVAAHMTRRVDERMLLTTAAAAQRLRKEYSSHGRSRY
jgi:hypothetical protein